MILLMNLSAYILSLEIENLVIHSEMLRINVPHCLLERFVDRQTETVAKDHISSNNMIKETQHLRKLSKVMFHIM